MAAERQKYTELLSVFESDTNAKLVSMMRSWKDALARCETERDQLEAAMAELKKRLES